MLDAIRKSSLTVAALGALGIGGAAIANAADKDTTPAMSSSATTTSRSQATRAQREALSDEIAAKVKAAALAEVPGATVLRTQAGGPYTTPYHAHIQTSDGTRRVVLVNSSFEATAVQAERARGGGRGGSDHRGGPGRGGETALTGETKEKVEAAVLARYSGATIVRRETNNDSTAPYESHVTTSAGTELEVLVSSAFEIVDARERSAHR